MIPAMYVLWYQESKCFFQGTFPHPQQIPTQVSLRELSETLGLSEMQENEDKAAAGVGPRAGLTAAWNQIQGRRGNWTLVRQRSAAIGPLCHESHLALSQGIETQATAGQDSCSVQLRAGL